MWITCDPSWQRPLGAKISHHYIETLQARVTRAYQTESVYPEREQIFAALHHTPLPQVRVVILGQDPYHGPGQAHGLAFSVPATVAVPPSLRNILTEVRSDVGTTHSTSGNLTHWAEQGVLLLNTTLTVRAGAAGSHRHFGWSRLTDHIIRIVSEQQPHVAFLLWGAHAIAKYELIDTNKHLVLTAPHPSPLSAYRGFFGCRHFSQTNKFLETHGLSPIIW